MRLMEKRQCRVSGNPFAFVGATRGAEQRLLNRFSTGARSSDEEKQGWQAKLGRGLAATAAPRPSPQVRSACDGGTAFVSTPSCG